MDGRAADGGEGGRIEMTPASAVSIPGPWRYRSQWMPELAALAAISIAGAALFVGTDLDLRIAALFHGGSFPRPRDLAPVWRGLYKGAGWLVALVAAGCVAVLLAAGRRPSWRARRRAAVFVLLAYAIGPGLIVNVGFKNFWGRPRPLHVREFGGGWAYQDVAEPGTPGRGKSFPCGHSSAGYALTCFWLIWKRRYPRRAAAALGIALVGGTALGIGRIITGSHFASDVLASGVIAHLSNVLLYYFALNVPGREDRPPSADAPWRLGRGAQLAWGAVGAGVAGAALLATPYYSEFEHVAPSAPPDATRLALRLPAAEVSLRLHPGSNLVARGRAEGFGMFHSRLVRRWGGGDGDLVFGLERMGWFTDLSVDLAVSVPTSWVREVAVEMPGGWLAFDAPRAAPWAISMEGVRGRLAIPAKPARQRPSPPERGAASARNAAGG